MDDEPRRAGQGRWGYRLGCGFSRSIADPHEQGGNRDVLIQIVPVDAAPPAAHDVVRPLLSGCVEQPREVGEGNAELTSVRQINPHRILVESNMSR